MRVGARMVFHPCDLKHPLIKHTTAYQFGLACLHERAGPDPLRRRLRRPWRCGVSFKGGDGWMGLSIVKRQLLGGWRLEQLRPPKQVHPRNVERAGRKLGVSPGDPVPKLIKGNVEEAEDDAGTSCTSLLPAGVAFCPRPHSPIYDNVTSKPDGTQSDLPLQALDPPSAGASFGFRRRDAGVKPVHPIVSGQTEGGCFMFDYLGERGLPRTGKTASEVERGHWKISDLGLASGSRSAVSCRTALRSRPQGAANQRCVAMVCLVGPLGSGVKTERMGERTGEVVKPTGCFVVPPTIS